MTKLLFLFDELEKFPIRICEEGFFETCSEFGVSPSKIIALNGLTKEPKPYSIVLIERSKHTFLYQVMPEDSLESIGEKFGTNSEQLLKINRINYIFPFQTIEIPIR